MSEKKEPFKRALTGSERLKAAQPVEHSLLLGRGVRTAVDLWGWESTPFYQRYENRVVSPAFIKKRVVDESWKHGANLLEMYRGGYPFEDRAGWTRESTEEFHRYVHDRGMTVHWFPHRTDPMCFAGAVSVLMELGRKQFDVLINEPGSLMDGLGTEQWSATTPLLMWLSLYAFNPHMYIYTDNHKWTNETLPNEQDVSASNGSGTDDQTVGYYKLHKEIRKEGGLQFWGSQIECRTGGVGNNVFGRRGHADWVLKQANDQFREKLRGTKMVSPSAMWWINEAENVTPQQHRRYVYGISQDPVRCAVSAKIKMLGIEVEERKGPSLPQRYDMPNGTGFIQNNYLRLYSRHDSACDLLCFDPEHLAHFDNNSKSVIMAQPLAQTIEEGGRKVSAPVPVRIMHPEPAGYKAVLKADADLDFIEFCVEEERRYNVLNDTPWVTLEIRRKIHGGKKSLGTRIAPDSAYDIMIVEGCSYREDFEGDVPGRLVIRDSDGVWPDLVVMLLEMGELERVVWKCGQLELWSAASDEDSFILAVAVPDGLYTEKQYTLMQQLIQMPVEEITLGQGSAVVKNPLDIPAVRVVRINDPDNRPYLVREFDRWVFRGAQPANETPGGDYLKCCLPAGGEAAVLRYGFINDTARPGWGCQYTTAITKAESNGTHMSVDVDVSSVTSFLFAPRVQLAGKVKSVWLDGKPWHYFEDDCVMLPNRKGHYRIGAQVLSETEKPDIPHIARTFAVIDDTCVDGECLAFTSSLPPWTVSIPDDYFFTAFVRHEGRAVTDVENAQLVRTRPGSGSVVRFKTGKVGLRMSPAEKGETVEKIDVKDEIVRVMGKMSADLVEVHIDNAKVDRIELEQARDNPKLFKKYGVVVWWPYFYDELPEYADKKLAACLRDFVKTGGGLLLGLNALRLLSDITGCKPLEAVRTTHMDHHKTAGIKSLGLQMKRPKHPVFEGMTRICDNTDMLEWLNPSYDDILKGIDWDSDEGGEVLADLKVIAGSSGQHPIFAYEERKNKALLEWKLGSGRIIGAGMGLRYTYGSFSDIKPHENMKRLLANILNYLIGDKQYVLLLQ